ncbi:Alcohol dehydrogenase, class III [Handroanthus impetiginosus]|uniref:Alcohol dehydrogenase, class III n=1 Tax=Handroanthus impetiginosus TaxID=429701 RepID=A0A2G9GVQ6_9LAMI|nr:Alcohol dehydrogenase, class III [Handroanthus impetiginosus]
MPSSGVIRCKAALAWAAGEPLVIEEVELSPPQPMEIRIKVVCTSLCRSDLTAWLSQAQPQIFPRIFGHEASGIVESVGEGVTEFEEGDHVLTLFTGECKKCRQCASGKSNICQMLGLERQGVMHSDKQTRFSIKGKPIYHYCAVSSFSEYTVVHSGCAVAQGAKLRGASRIIGVDTNSDKSEIAKAFGVTEFLNPHDHDQPVQQVINRITDGGVDYAFECVGDTGIVSTALQSCSNGWGLTVTLGVPKEKPEIAAHYGLFLTGRTLTGSLFGGWKPKSDLPSLVEMYLRKEINVDDYITHNLNFEDINKAFELMREGKCLRCVIHMAKV